MTDIQVRYWDLQENKRHNAVTEAETFRHNSASENLEGKRITLGYAELGETKRHNKATEKLTATDIAEKTRHNKATEKETKRHNKKTEGIQNKQANASMIMAKASQSQAETAAKRAQTEAEKLQHYKEYEWPAKQNQIISEMNRNFYDSENKRLSAEAQKVTNEILDDPNWIARFMTGPSLREVETGLKAFGISGGNASQIAGIITKVLAK